MGVSRGYDWWCAKGTANGQNRVGRLSTHGRGDVLAWNDHLLLQSSYPREHGLSLRTCARQVRTPRHCETTRVDAIERKAYLQIRCTLYVVLCTEPPIFFRHMSHGRTATSFFRDREKQCRQSAQRAPTLKRSPIDRI